MKPGNVQTPNPAITTSKLRRCFGSQVALADIDLAIPAGCVTGLVGPNGSGKSTFMRTLLGLLRPTAGTATVLGIPITDPARYLGRVGSLIEYPALEQGLSARGNLGALARLRGVGARRVDAVLETVGLTDRADDRVGGFSLGMKQRLGIAMALLPDPELLLLDEPTNGLDPAGVVEIRTLIRRLGAEGRSVVVSSHLMSEIEATVDHLAVIRDGHVRFDGPLDQLLAHRSETILVDAADRRDVLVDLYRRAGFEARLGSDGIEIAPNGVGTIDASMLNALAADAGIVLRRLEPRHQNLEAVFLMLTGAQPQEAA